MSWDERFFNWLLKTSNKIRGQSAPLTTTENQFLTLGPRLKLIASALSGRTIEIKEAESVGGMKGDTLLLPQTLNLSAELETQAFIYRAAYSVMLQELEIFLPEDLETSNVAQAVLGAQVSPYVRYKLLSRYPRLKDIDELLVEQEIARRQTSRQPQKLKSPVEVFIYSALNEKPKSKTPEELRSDLIQLRDFPKETEKTVSFSFPLFWSYPYSQRAHAANRRVPNQGGEPNQTGSLPTGTERKGKPKEHVEEVKFAEDKENENPLVHVFEKVKTADDYLGGRKALDGDDELEEQLEAIQELDLRKIIRSRDRTQSIYKSEIMLDSSVGDLDDESAELLSTPYIYDEWNESTHTYRKDWCKVFVTPSQTSVTPDQTQKYIQEARVKNYRQVRELREQLEKIKALRRWKNRQLDGSEIDIDALVDWRATVHSGHSSNTGLYLSRPRQERDFATLVLLDCSLSTDSWIKDHRVMDVLKESMLVLGEVVSEFGDQFAIGAFHSNTRSDCRYIAVKNFEDSWQASQSRLIGLKPAGYTRIGPALRHATFLLKEKPAKKKLLLLISDGKPTDFDRYEGKYGVADIRQAVREATAENVIVRSLAIDAQAKFYLPQMFGPGNFQILPNPSLLAKSLAELYSWLMK